MAVSALGDSQNVLDIKKKWLKKTPRWRNETIPKSFRNFRFWTFFEGVVDKAKGSKVAI